MLLAPSAFGTSPKFDKKILYANYDFGVEFWGGWVGANAALL
jgi:hypothetical protein